MKKLLIILIMLNSEAFAQPSIGFKYLSRGAGAEIGYLSPDGVRLAASYTIPLLNALKPQMAVVHLGKVFNMGKFDIAPVAGIASLKTITLDEKDARIGKTVIAGTGGIELGFHQHNGHVYLTGNYAKGFYFGAGLRYLIN